MCPGASRWKGHLTVLGLQHLIWPALHRRVSPGWQHDQVCADSNSKLLGSDPRRSQSFLRCCNERESWSHGTHTNTHTHHRDTHSPSHTQLYNTHTHTHTVTYTDTHTSHRHTHTQPHSYIHRHTHSHSHTQLHNRHTHSHTQLHTQTQTHTVTHTFNTISIDGYHFNNFLLNWHQLKFNFFSY